MNLKWAGLGIVVILAGAGGYWGKYGHSVASVSSDSASPGSAPISGPVSVSVALVQQRDIPLSMKAVGRVEAKASVSVKSRLDAQVVALAYAEGGPVHKGQLLVRMDSSVLEAQLHQAEAVAARDEAVLERLQGDSRRNASLAAQGFISTSALSQTEADLRAAQATLKADHASIDNARQQLSYARILAPMDGQAGAILLPVGGAAKANDTTLLVINQTQPIYISFAIPETQLGRLKLALAAGPVSVQASLPGLDKILTGKLAFIDNAVDSTTGTILVKAEFANLDSLLTTGQFAQVQVQLEQLHQALVVPTAAADNGLDGAFVFVVKPDMTVEIRAVKTAGEHNGFTIIRSGLALGESVVTSGQARLRAKSKVTVMTNGATDAGSAASGTPATPATPASGF